MFPTWPQSCSQMWKGQGWPGLGQLRHTVWKEAGSEAGPDRGVLCMSGRCILTLSSVPQAKGRQYLGVRRLQPPGNARSSRCSLVSELVTQRLQTQTLEADYTALNLGSVSYKMCDFRQVTCLPEVTSSVLVCFVFFSQDCCEQKMN